MSTFILCKIYKSECEEFRESIEIIPDYQFQKVFLCFLR